MNKIYVYWWALHEGGAIDNYGDILAPFLDEKLSSRTIFASGIILVGVILMTLGRKKTSKVVDFENT